MVYGTVKLLGGTRESCELELVFRGGSRWIEQVEVGLLFDGVVVSGGAGAVLGGCWVDGMGVPGSFGVLERGGASVRGRVLLGGRVRGEVLVVRVGLVGVLRVWRRVSVVLLGGGSA